MVTACIDIGTATIPCIIMHPTELLVAVLSVCSAFRGDGNRTVLNMKLPLYDASNGLVLSLNTSSIVTSRSNIKIILCIFQGYGQLQNDSIVCLSSSADIETVRCGSNNCGAIAADHSSIVTRNEALNADGAVSVNDTDHVTVIGSFIGNTALIHGGAMSANYANFTECTFHSRIAVGGGLLAYRSSVSLKDIPFTARRFTEYFVRHRAVISMKRQDPESTMQMIFSSDILFNGVDINRNYEASMGNISLLNNAKGPGKQKIMITPNILQIILYHC